MKFLFSHLLYNWHLLIIIYWAGVQNSILIWNILVFGRTLVQSSLTATQYIKIWVNVNYVVKNGICCQIVLPKPNTFTSSPTQGPPSNKSQTSATKAAAPTKKFRRVKKESLCSLGRETGDVHFSSQRPNVSTFREILLLKSAPRGSRRKLHPEENMKAEQLFSVDKLGKLKMYLDPLPPNFWLIIGRKNRKSGDKSLYFPKNFLLDWRRHFMFHLAPLTGARPFCRNNQLFPLKFFFYHLSHCCV